MAAITTIESCRFCPGSRLKMVLPLIPTPVGDYYLPKEQEPEKLECYPLDVYQCEDCGHVQLKAIVDPDYLYREYIYTTSSSLGMADHFRDYVKTVIDKLALKPGSLVVEIGSNDGTMLRVWKELGFNVLGIDPARDIAKQATDSGIPTMNDFFTPALAEEIHADKGEAALLIANNVMANVPNPTEVVTGVRKLLGDNGVFVFETGYLKYLAEDVVFDNIYHEHIDYYSIKPSIGFFNSLGLELFDVDVSDSKGSSIRTYVQSLSGNKRPVADVVRQLSARESEVGYGIPAPYDKLNKKLEATKSELLNTLSKWKAEGKTIAGYGASVGVTTVLYHFELNGLIDYLIDDNSARQGLYSPGLAIPIRGPEVLTSAEPPDYILILAWRYAEPIMSKNQEYLKNGGRFLKFLPEIELIGDGNA